MPAYTRSFLITSSGSAGRALRHLCIAIASIAAGTAGAQQDGPSDIAHATTSTIARTLGRTAAVRWESTLAEFARNDRQRPPRPGGVLFVGSSSIRLWHRLPQDFSQLPVVINRGFGGSTMADCQQLVRELVIRYQPRQVIVYAGENDLAEGRSPQDVLGSFRGFVQAVRQALPAVRLAYVSIKPSPQRIALLPRVRETNQLLASYIATLPDAHYVDVHSPMLDTTGAPRTELFGPDRLHMNDAGYAIWRTAIGKHVMAPAAVAAAPLGPPAVDTPVLAGP